tara:strand:- start:97119 stop:97340 length:222 start_codon:yes stop_codon:yes gene_type:complete
MIVNYGGKPFIIKATLEEVIRGYLIYLEEQCELDEDCDSAEANIRQVHIGPNDSGTFKEISEVKVTINCSTEN